jgi:methylglutamate dehydrogenase subunit D
MAEPAPASPWAPRRAWDGTIADGRLGASGAAGVTIRTRDALGIATLIARAGGEAALAAAIGERLGLALPQSPGALRSGAHQIVWSGPAQWLLFGDSRAGFAGTLAGLAGLAAVSDQSDSRAVVSLSGPRIRDALAKGCMIDLHPAAFPPGAAAMTSIAHMGVCLWRAADGARGSVFEIMVARSMAGSFWSWLSASAAEFGCVVSRQA